MILPVVHATHATLEVIKFTIGIKLVIFHLASHCLHTTQTEQLEDWGVRGRGRRSMEGPPTSR